MLNIDLHPFIYTPYECAGVSVHDYESVGLGSNIGSDCWRAAQPAVRPSFRAGRQMGAWGKPGKVNNANLDVALSLCRVNGSPHHRLKGPRGRR